MSTNPNVPNVRLSSVKFLAKLLLQSAGNLSGVQFTITGRGEDGRPRSLTIAGPNNSTVNTGGTYFSIVNSVSANLPVASNVRVGSGPVGVTNWFYSDYYKQVSNLSINVFVGGTINYTFQTTSDYIIRTPIDGVTIPTVPASTPMISQTVSCSADYTVPTYASRIAINSAGADGFAVITFLQQG